MDLEQAAGFVLEEGKRYGIDSFDLIATDSEDIGIEVFKGRIVSTETSRSRGVGIRVLNNSRPGYSYSERFSKEALSRMIRDAMDQTEITDPLDMELPGPKPLAEVDLKHYNSELEKLDFSWMRELGQALDHASWESDKRVENVPHVGVGKSSTQSLIANSNGVFVKKESNVAYCGTGLVVAEGDIKKMGSYYRSGRDISKFDPSFIAKEAANRGTELLGAKPLSSGVYTILLGNRISPQIFGMFSSPYFADAVQKGSSRLVGKLGSEVASPILSLYCEAHTPDYPGSRLVDAEGIPTSARTKVLENGILKSYLYNLESAKKDNVSPTGHGVRSYSGRAGTSFSNMIVPLGNKTREELLASDSHCILVTKLEGGAGCSAVSGEISIGIQGIYYKNGKPEHAVDRITMNTNYFDLLHKIQGISNEYSDSYSSIKIPDILISEIHIAG
ncbi:MULTISPECIES: TldD/PmbA family protein [unclassified Leptospira]|uniref:TldD/PmbA family protein n=1 Tax=unclassified Leptospira TaxID=2633828 RepID=UPI0002BE8606|nr:MULTISPECIES: TldD/PmbA family protein [unclassified Leptospira]EMK01741.1 TldD/PmbA family protein [Leptospira sp. B5-022]MCR1793929.1 TldD/PmbA family protein [Leptospira sp. id769339]